MEHKIWYYEEYQVVQVLIHEVFQPKRPSLSGRSTLNYLRGNLTGKWLHTCVKEVILRFVKPGRSLKTRQNH